MEQSFVWGDNGQRRPMGMMDQYQAQMQQVQDPMQGLSNMAKQYVGNMSQYDKIKLGSLFGLGGTGLY